jgi:hypothetical protein
MADISITAADVIKSNAGTAGIYVVGTNAVTQGEVVYLDSNNKIQLAIATSAATATLPLYLTLSAASPGQTCAILSADPALILGYANTNPEVYYLSSANAGKITATIGDLTTGNLVVVLAVGVTTGSASAATVNFNPMAGGTV